MAVPVVGTGFGSLYISTNTIHGYVNKISGATSYIIYYRPSSSSTATTVTAGSNGYFFITGLSSGTEYVINYRGVNSDGEGNTMATGKTFVAKNDRSSWTLYSGGSWGNFASEGTKSVSYLTDDCYLYCYSMTFAASGTVKIEFDANFSVASYLSTQTSHSNGKPTSGVVASVENSGSSYTLTATVTAETTYYLYFRGNNGRQYIGKVGLYLTAPKKTTYYIKVSYDANGGSGAPSAQTANDTDNRVPITLSSTKPTKSKQTFVGWATTKSATYASYYASQQCEFESTSTSQSSPTLINLYAVWQAESDGGYVSIWSGSKWVNATPYIWTGQAWVKAVPYVRTESAWKKAGG